MIQKYISVLQRYFVQYLGGFDVTVLKEVVQVGAPAMCNVINCVGDWQEKGGGGRGGEGDNPKNACFKRRLKFFWEFEDFARNLQYYIVMSGIC